MMNFQNYSGKNIKIAILDSGVKVEHPDFKVCKIKNYLISNDKYLKDDIGDVDFGHGTACAWLIHKIAPKAEIFSFRCFDKSGRGDVQKILNTLHWCIQNDIDIINLSFGAFSSLYLNEFELVGQEAKQKNTLIFASCHDSGYMSIPAKLENYVAVCGKSVKGKYKYYYSDNRFIAHGGRQRVAWNTYPYIIADGSSFATARMTGIAALYKEAYPNADFIQLLTELKSGASVEEKIDSFSINIDRVAENNAPFYKIDNAVIYSFTKEMHHLILSRDLTGININGVVDLPLKPTIGKKTSDLLQTDIELTIERDITEILQKQICDTVIISRTNVYENIFQKDILKHVLNESIKHNKNIYSLEYIDCNMYPELFIRAKEKGLKIRHPMLSKDDLCRMSTYRDIYGHIGSKTPVVGIFGTGPSQGKFTAQLSLRKIFQEKGYCVNNYGTETYSELFGFEGYYPLEMSKSVRFEETQMLEFIQGDIRRLEIENKPDIIFVGSQSGVIPSSYAINSTEYTLPTLTFLMATIPHIYILAVNAFDEISFIRRTIQVLEALGKGRVIGFIINRKHKMVYKSSSLVVESQLADIEYEEFKKSLENEFDIPSFDMFCRNDIIALYNEIINVFS